MKRKVGLFIFLVSLLILTSCSSEKTEGKDPVIDKEDLDNFNESGMPIVDEPITLHFLTGGSTSNKKDYNDIMIWKEYSDMTNINIEWEMMPESGLSEKRNLALASGSLPDVFYTSQMPNIDLLKYGEEGVFVELTDLITEYMPNLNALLEEYPEIEKGMKFPDGNIYSLPTIYSPDFTSVLAGQKNWIRKDWLEKLDMDIPETTDEYYHYLKAVKETDLIGDGKNNEIPYGGYRTTVLTRWLKGAFGVGNRGINHNYIDADPETDDVRFYPIEEGYKEMLTYLHKLYSEGLIQKNIFSIEKDQHYANGTEGLYGSSVLNSPEATYGKVGKDYVGMPALKGPNGDHIYSYVNTSLAHMNGFILTEDNENIPETLRWMDYFYSDEGAKLFFMGIEGETFEEKDDGEIDYVDEIKNDPDLTLEQKLADYFTWMGGGYPGIVKSEFFKGAESLPSSIEAAEKIEGDLPEEVWPDFTYTIDESNKLSSLAADIEKYVDEMQDKFITGDESLSDWDKYIKTLEKMGLQDYIDIQQTAYERYKAN